MRLSEHDQEMVAEVAAFCSTDVARPALNCVHFDQGMVLGTDSYRVDIRETDEDGTFSLNPFDLTRFDNRHPIRIDPLLRLTGSKPLGCADGINPSDLAKPSRGSVHQAFCVCCRVTSTYPSGALLNGNCQCVAPLVQPQYLAAALRAADGPVRWTWTGDPLKPITYREEGHINLVMPIRKTSR